MNNKPSAQIIADSVSPAGVRLTTFILTFHRYILAELNTHRDLSRSSASSRAIPSAKMIERVETNPALPIHFGSNQPGMQANIVLEKQYAYEAEKVWIDASKAAITRTNYLTNTLGLHKQVANRLLEPFNWHTAIVTTTRLDNFFWQRCDKDAQPEFKALADAMQYAYYMGNPIHVDNDVWHIPFADDDETVIEINQQLNLTKDLPAVKHAIDVAGGFHQYVTELQKELSVARCARVSYLQHDGSRAIEKDFDMYDKLMHGMHPSPAEHQGTPCTHVENIKFAQDGFYLLPGDDNDSLEVRCKLTGNFDGWHQLRKFWKGENRTNFIPNLPELADVAERIKAGEKLW